MKPKNPIVKPCKILATNDKHPVINCIKWEGRVLTSCLKLLLAILDVLSVMVAAASEGFSAGDISFDVDPCVNS